MTFEFDHEKMSEKDQERYAKEMSAAIQKDKSEKLYKEYGDLMYSKPQPYRSDPETIELVAVGLRYALTLTGSKQKAILKDLAFRLEGGYDNFFNPPKEVWDARAKEKNEL